MYQFVLLLFVRKQQRVFRLNIFVCQVKLTKKQNAKDEQTFTDIIEKNKRNINLEKSNRKKIDDHLDVYRDKKNV